jgi:hypothetical protein
LLLLVSLSFLFFQLLEASFSRFQNKNAPFQGQFCVCGERGIRTPGPVTVNGFQDRRIRPLCHLSGRKIIIAGGFSKKTFQNSDFYFQNAPSIYFL